MILTTKEVCKFLRVSMPTILKEAERLGGVKIGREWRFSTDRLKEIIGELPSPEKK